MYCRSYDSTEPSQTSGANSQSHHSTCPPINVSLLFDQTIELTALWRFATWRCFYPPVWSVPSTVYFAPDTQCRPPPSSSDRNNTACRRDRNHSTHLAWTIPGVQRPRCTFVWFRRHGLAIGDRQLGENHCQAWYQVSCPKWGRSFCYLTNDFDFSTRHDYPYPLFEGAFSYGNDIYHIRTKTNYHLYKRHDDPHLLDHWPMVIYRDSDIHNSQDDLGFVKWRHHPGAPIYYPGVYIRAASRIITLLRRRTTIMISCVPWRNCRIIANLPVHCPLDDPKPTEPDRPTTMTIMTTATMMDQRINPRKSRKSYGTRNGVSANGMHPSVKAVPTLEKVNKGGTRGVMTFY